MALDAVYADVITEFPPRPGTLTQHSALWLLPGMVSLALFAWLLTLVDTSHAGRAYAAYGSVYICASLVWLWGVEGARPDRWDVLGAGIALVGAAVIVFGPRPS